MYLETALSVTPQYTHGREDVLVTSNPYTIPTMRMSTSPSGFICRSSGDYFQRQKELWLAQILAA